MHRLIVVLLLGCQACAHSGATAALPEWVRTPAQQRGTQLLFVGQGEASSEAEATAAALRAAREEAARVQGVRIESELRSQVGQIGMAGPGGTTTLSWESVAQATEQVRLTTQQQRSATTQVVETMDQLSDASRQVSATAQQLASASASLAGLAGNLEHTAASASEPRGEGTSSMS
jgi:hypothetical protein